MVLFLLLALAAPRFESFPAKDIFKGKPAAPKLVSKSQRRFRTQILDGAGKGPNFAGRYTIVQWGCGASCVSSVIVDARTGAVYALPFETLSFGMDVQEPFSFRQDSSLLIVRGCPNEKDCGEYYYEWRELKLRPIK